MIIRKSFLFCLLIFLYSCQRNKTEEPVKQDFTTGIRQLVLNQNEKGQEYFFKLMKPKEVLEYKVTYIGNAHSKSDGELKFIAYTILSGLYEDSKRANSSIYLYKENGVLLGSYYVGGGFEILPSVVNDTLIIQNKFNYCNQTTRISFSDSIPQEIFIGCKEENGKMYGDLYNFKKEKLMTAH